MAVILNNKKSTYSGPNAYYTVETTNITNRTQTSVDISFKVTVHLGNSESLSGTGRPLTGGLYLNGTWNTFVIKNSSTSWSGTTKHYINTTITVSGLTASQSSITGVQFRSLGSSSGSTYGGILTATSCSDITIPIGHTPPSVTLTSITETNADLISAGVSNDTFVANMSIKTFQLGAQLYDNASVSSYRIKWDNTLYETQTSSNPANITINFKNNPIIVNNNSVTLNYSVVDSMSSVSNVISSNYTAIPYLAPTLSSTTSVKRYGQTSGLVRLNIAGTYFNGTIGNTTNDIEIRYRYYEVGATPSVTDHYISSAYITKSDGTFQVSSYEIGSTTETDPNYFDYTKSYVVEIYVDDAFNTTTVSKRITKGVPVWSEYSDRVWFEKAEAKNIYATEGIYLNGEPIGTGGKNILKASLSSNFSITSAGVKQLNLQTVDFKKGNKFSISNTGKIVIGSGITAVKVSGCVYFSAGTNAGDSLRAGIQYDRNGTSTSVSISVARAGTTGTYEVRNLVPVPVEVEEGDEIWIYANNSTAGRGTISGQANSTYLIVEEI